MKYVSTEEICRNLDRMFYNLLYFTTCPYSSHHDLCYAMKEKMFFIVILLIFVTSNGQTLTLEGLNVRFTSMEAKIERLESELKTLKSQDQDLEATIELKEVQADVSFILMEQAKLSDRDRASAGCSDRISR